MLATSLPLVLAAGLLVPAMSWTAVTWLLPALALTALRAGRLHLGAAHRGRGRPRQCCGPCAVGAAAVDHDPGAVLAPGRLLAYAALGAAAMVVLRVRIHQLTHRRSLS